MKCHEVRYLIPLAFAIVLQTALAFGPVAGFGMQGPSLPIGPVASALVFGAPQGQGILGQPQSSVGFNQSLATNSQEFNTLDWSSVIIICFPQDLQNPWASTVSMFQTTPSAGKIGLPVDGFPIIPPAWEPALPYVRSNDALRAGPTTGYIAGPIIGDPPVPPELLPYVNTGNPLTTTGDAGRFGSFSASETTFRKIYDPENFPFPPISPKVQMRAAETVLFGELVIDHGPWVAVDTVRYGNDAHKHGESFARRYDLGGTADNAADAVRHAHWLFEMSRKFGYATAIAVSNAYENNSEWKYGYLPEDQQPSDQDAWASRFMDTLNNDTAARAAHNPEYASSNGYLASEKLYEQGKLITEPPTAWPEKFDPVMDDYITPPNYDNPTPNLDRDPTGVGNIA